MERLSGDGVGGVKALSDPKNECESTSFYENTQVGQKDYLFQKEGNKIKVSSFDFLTMVNHLDLC